jgi:hypothetical protein
MHTVKHLQTWHKIIGAAILLLGTALLFFVVAKPVGAQSTSCTYTDDNGLLSGVTVQKRQVGYQVDKLYSSSAWTGVTCGAPHEFSGTLPLLMLDGKLLPGQKATVTVDTEANLICAGNPSDPTDYCEARVLLNGADMDTDPDHFHWAPVTNQSNWGNYSFSRSTNVECPLTLENILSLGCEIGQVELQVRNAGGTTLRIDALNVDAYLHPQTLVL